MKTVSAFSAPVCALPIRFVQADSHRQATWLGRPLLLNSRSHLAATITSAPSRITSRHVVMRAAEVNSGEHESFKFEKNPQLSLYNLTIFPLYFIKF